MALGVKIEDIAGIHVLGGIRAKHYNPWFASRHWIEHIRQEFGVPDLVNFHSTYIPFHIALAQWCQKLNWPYIVTPRGGMTCLAQNVKGFKKKVSNVLYYRSYVKHAAAIHALCRREAQDIDKLFEAEKIITIPNGVEDHLLAASDKLQPIHLSNFGDKTTIMLGFVGRIDIYHKGLDLLLEAMAILKSQPLGPKYKLFIVGPFHTPKDEQLLRSIIDTRGLNDFVKLLGPKFDEEKLRHFLACDVFVHTSRFEGMPLAVLEAMALGRPCLVTPGTNIADVVCEGGGWQCQLDPNSIAESLRDIYQQKDSLRVLGKQSHELIKTRFTWPKIAQQMSEEYAKIVNT